MGKIQIKRRGQNSDKSIESISLEAGELLVDLKDNNNKLYVGDAEGKPQLVSGDETRLSTLEAAIDNRATKQALNTEISARQQADSFLQAQIDGITAGGASHGHANKGLLDTITQDDITTWNSKANSADVVANNTFDTFKTENDEAIAAARTGAVSDVEAKGYAVATEVAETYAEKATTLAGYGITDAYTKAEAMGKTEAYTKTEVDRLLDEVSGGSSETAAFVKRALDGYIQNIDTELYGAETVARWTTTDEEGHTTYNPQYSVDDSRLDTALANAATAKEYADGLVESINEAATALKNTVDTHVGSETNPHKVTKAQVGLGNVENKSVAEIKTEFTGTVATDNKGFVTGGAVHNAIQTAKTTVINSLDSDKEDAALSAKQGYILNSKIQYGNELPEQNTALSEKDLPEGTIYLYIPD